MEGDFELMTEKAEELPIHRGEASMSASDVDDGIKVLSDYAKKVTGITILVAVASLLTGCLAMW